jgi:pectate lyase
MNATTQQLVESLERHVRHISVTCRDRYGPKHSPLLANSVDLSTGEPATWEGHVLSNFASHQNFLRVLHGLSLITGDAGYAEQASVQTVYALDELSDPDSGMLYWGGHSSYDILADAPLIGNHELKCVYPYYGFLYQTAPDITRRLIEGIWNNHLCDWSTLLFSRHGEYRTWDEESPWQHEYVGGPLPIIENTALSFINTGSDLIHAAAQLYHLSGSEEPLKWAKRLLNRYVEIRNPDTGLGAYQFNHRDPCRARMSFAPPFCDREDVNESTVITSGTIGTRYGRAVLTWLNLYEELGKDSAQELLDMSEHDLSVLAEYSYDFDAHVFYPLLADGTRLQPDNCVEGAGYYSPRSLAPVRASSSMLLAYTRTYRFTGNPLLWRVARNLAEGIGWGWLAEATTEDGPQPRAGISQVIDQSANTQQNDAFVLLTLLELHKASGSKEYLNLAAQCAQQLSQTASSEGGFTTGENLLHLNHPLPVALLHVAAALENTDVSVPLFYPGTSGFDPKVIIAYRK